MLEFYRFILRKTNVAKEIIFFMGLAFAVTWINIQFPNLLTVIGVASCILGSRLAVSRYYDYREIWIEKTESPITIDTFHTVNGKEELISRETVGKHHPELLKNIHIGYTGILIGFNIGTVLLNWMK